MHQPRKRFGQHFLHDPDILRRIVQAIGPTTNDNLVEIGPGAGALTEHILPAAGKMQAIEIDTDLIPLLNERCQSLGELNIINQDVLNVDFKQFGENLRIIGNLPYNISTPILFHALQHIERIRDMHFMLQKEVVDRIVAKSGSKDYGRLSVMSQYFCEVSFLFKVPASAFNPPPKVQSAIVRLTPHRPSPYPEVDVKRLSQVVKLAFATRRKMLRNCLQALVTADQLANIGIDPTRRAETLSVTEFCNICIIATQSANKD